MSKDNDRLSNDVVDKRLESDREFIDNIRFNYCREYLHRIGSFQDPIMKLHLMSNECQKVKNGEPCVTNKDLVCDREIFKLVEE